MFDWLFGKKKRPPVYAKKTPALVEKVAAPEPVKHVVLQTAPLPLKDKHVWMVYGEQIGIWDGQIFHMVAEDGSTKGSVHVGHTQLRRAKRGEIPACRLFPGMSAEERDARLTELGY